LLKNDERHPGDKNDHLEKQIVKMKALPLHMAELGREEAGCGCVERFSESVER
jgi:hypothetical protein